MSLSIKTKLILCIIGLGSALAALGGFGFYTATYAAAREQMLAQDHIAPIYRLKQVSDNYAVTVVDATHRVAFGEFSAADALKSLEVARTQIGESWSASLRTSEGFMDGEQEAFASVVATKVAADAAFDKFENLLRLGDMAELEAFRTTELYPAIDPLTAAIDDVLKLLVNNGASDAAADKDLLAFFVSVIVSIAACSALFLLGALWIVLRQVVKPINALTGAMTTLANGDNSTVVPGIGRKDEIGQMAATVETFKQNAIAKLEAEKLAETQRIAAEWQGAGFKSSPAAMMLVDRDLNITYVNEATLQLMRKNVDTFRKIWPTFNPDKLVGSSIDQFHKNPGHQRSILGDPARLPHKTDIKVGEIQIELNVSAVRDGAGNHLGSMLAWEDVTAKRTNQGMLTALGRSQAVIEFGVDGTIIDANDLFLQVLGYSASEIRGKHHSMFVDQAYRNSPDYRRFWESLAKGEYQSDKFERIAKGGKTVWIQATYNPVFDGNGKVYKVVKFASDVTDIENERKAAEQERALRAREQGAVVSSLAEGLRQLSNGNVTARLDAEFPKDYEQLRHDFNDAMAKLQDALKRIATGAESITTGSSEISNAADDLSRRTEQQAASLEETAAALDQITATVKKSAEGANSANAVVVAVRKDGETSGEIVRKAVAAMGEIEKSAKQISQIIGVIDEIAFQTNLLALNAGVEAARAGEAGRGFAVVASEVRALAQRSADAAKQIKGLISESSQQVEDGVELVGEAGESLVRILDQIGRISHLVSEIAGSAKEQATGLTEVNSAVNQMDQVTQQNAAMVEESTAASRSLAKEAADLASLVSEFNIGERVAMLRSSGGYDQASRNQGRSPAKQMRTTSQRKVLPAPAEADWEEF